jgi:signal transduction histidine kinase/CheY-like chemotaxis protein
VRQDSLESIRDAIQSVRLGRSGDVVVLGGKGRQRGTYVIAPAPEFDGANVWDLRDVETGEHFVREHVERALELAPGETAFFEYTIRRLGEREPWPKVAAVSYFEPWDWVVVASMKREEVTEAGRRMSGSIATGVLVVLALAFLLLAATAWAARRAAARIAAPVEALRQVLDNVGEGFLSVDPAGDVSEHRSAIVDHWFGERRPGEPVWRYLGRDDAEFAARLERAWPSIFATPAAAAQLPSRFRSRERTFDLACRLAGAGAGARAILVVSDVTSAVEKERRELRMQAELQQAQKMEAVGRLASGVAHDFNNLLVVITSCSEFLLEGLPEGDPRRADAEDIREAGQRAARLVGQLLAFGRRSPAQPVVTDLNAVVGGLDKLVRRSIGEDVEVSFALAPAPRRLRIDPGQLEQVILNLVVNARDAMPRGGRLRVETANEDREAGGAGSPRRGVVLRVADSGCGIAPEVLPKIFEPFFTTKERGKGNGLGLSTVFGIVQQAHGTVGVTSEPGRGATFTVWLPATDEVAAPRPAPGAAPVDGGGATVLLVEDEDGVRRVTRRILAAHGFRVIDARDAEEARRRFAEERPALLLTDVVMPGTSGPELAAQLQREDPQLAVLFMSGYSDRADVWGAGTVLQKPFTDDALLARVGEALRPALRRAG